MRCHRSETRSTSALALLAVGLAFAPLTANAQIPPPARPGGQPPAMDQPSESTVPPADPGLGGDTPREPLSERLKRGEGVLEPPKNLDPEIRKPVPEDFKSKTPVIPPARDADGAPVDAEPNNEQQPIPKNK